MNETSPAMIDQIRQMQMQGHSINKIVLALGVSRNTVRWCMRQATLVENRDVLCHFRTRALQRLQLLSILA